VPRLDSAARRGTAIPTPAPRHDGIFDVLLLLALPASGKSEIRRYLDRLDGDRRAAEFHLGEPVELDDYPYVHLMRRISHEQRRLGLSPAFYATDLEPLLDPRDWMTLIHLLNEDYAMLEQESVAPVEAARWLFARLDTARAAAGAPPAFSGLDPAVEEALTAALEEEARALFDALEEARAPSLDGCTVVIEAARGAGEGMRPPYAEPYGYARALAGLAPEILERAVVLYVWVTPQESRRRNQERARPGREGEASILHHRTSEQVMRHDYAGDDIAWLLDHGDRSDCITITAHGRRFHLPTARLDNRADHTSFLRDDPGRWPPDAVERLHRLLHDAFDSLHRLLTRRAR